MAEGGCFGGEGLVRERMAKFSEDGKILRRRRRCLIDPRGTEEYVIVKE